MGVELGSAAKQAGGEEGGAVGAGADGGEQSSSAVRGSPPAHERVRFHQNRVRNDQPVAELRDQAGRDRVVLVRFVGGGEQGACIADDVQSYGLASRAISSRISSTRI